jgi:Ca2+-binding RTX toxin-like protein
LDKFTYHDTDSTGAVSNTATVTINVLNFDIPPKPAVAPEVNATPEDTTVTGTLLAGTDPDGPNFNGNGTPILNYSIVAGSATNGTVALVDANGVPIVPTLDPLTGQLVAFNTTGAYVFIPTPNYGTNLNGAPFADALFGGPATFQYVLNDSLKFSPPKTVSVNVTPVNDGSAPLTLTGTLAAGNILTATLGTDPEGLAPGLTPVFTWKSTSIVNGVPVTTVLAGLTGSTYALTEADVGHTFQASVTYTDGQNFTATAATATTNAAGEVFVKPTALATATTVTASNTLVNMFGTPAIAGAVTYTWDTSLDGSTWTTSVASGVTYAPVVTGVPGEYIRAVAHYTDNLGVAQLVQSLATHYINDTAPGTLGHPLTGVAGTDIIFAGPGDDVITPGAGNDYVYAGTGNNTIVATVGDGNDIYNGGAGTDTYDMSGTSAAATVILGGAVPQATSLDTGADTLISIENVIGGAGNDTISGDVNNNVLTGGAGDDTLNGNGGNDTLNGGAGNDTMNGGAGNDTMLGGVGNDLYIVDSALDVVTEAAGEGTDTVNTSVSYTLAAGSEVEIMNATGLGLTLTGNEFNNTVNGAGGNDTLFGGAGNDTLNGGAGADTMAGGLGNDTFIVDNAGDVVTEAGGQGTDTVNTSVSYTLAAGSEVEIMNATVGVAGTVGLTLTGNEFDNTVNGAAANDTLFGGAGNDRLNGGAGADAMSGGLGNDTYIVDNAGDLVTENLNEGTDTVNTNLGSYTLRANVENLNFTGAGNFAGTGNTLTNVIVGGAGNDTLDDGGVNGTGVVGADTMNGGAGNDTYFVRNAGETILDSGVGVNTVNTTLLSYTLAGNLQNLTFIGTGNFTAFDNVLTGGAGNDILSGLAGNDTLIGGAGNDTMTGGGGNDLFKYLAGTSNVGIDTITDFTNHNQGAVNKDLIDVSGLGLKVTDFGSKLTLTVTGGNMTVHFAGGGLSGSILLAGQNKLGAAGVDATDFKWAP